MPSSQIESIEIITNPSAKYDAAGNAGIINIRLKKNTRRGFNGSLSSGVSSGLLNEYNYLKTNHSINLNYGTEKVNVFASYGFDIGKSWSFMDIYRIQSEQIFDQETDNFERNRSQNAKFGADWKINSRHLLSATVDGNLSQSRSSSYSKNSISVINEKSPYTLLDAKNFANRDPSTGNFNLNHFYKDTSGREITTDFNLGGYWLDNTTNQPNFYRNFRPDSSVVDRSFGLTTPVNISIATLKTDYEQKLKKSVISFGYKVSNVLTDNEFSLFNRINGANDKDFSQSSEFSYLERVLAGYFSLRHSFNGKWSAQAGIRYEQTHSEGILSQEFAANDSIVKRNYGNFFPSAGLTYNLNKNNLFSLNYSRRIDRPVYRFLNPFQYKLDELSFEQGNPFLNPQYTDNFQVSHTFMSMVTSSVGYSNTTDFFARVIDSLGNKSFLTRRNLATVKTISVNVSSPLPIRNWWNGYINLTYNHQVYEADLGPGKQLKLPVDFYNIYMQHSFSLPKKVSLQVSGFYNSPNVWGGTFRNRTFWSMDAGITKKILKNKATISLTVSDLFLSQRWQGVSDFGGINAKVTGGRDSRVVRAGFTWNFGENVFKARKRKDGNSEERQRLRGD
jgi:outer membrane receptor protein involved in Fe transport